MTIKDDNLFLWYVTMSGLKETLWQGMFNVNFNTSKSSSKTGKCFNREECWRALENLCQYFPSRIKGRDIFHICPDCRSHINPNCSSLEQNTNL